MTLRQRFLTQDPTTVFGPSFHTLMGTQESRNLCVPYLSRKTDFFRGPLVEDLSRTNVLSTVPVPTDSRLPSSLSVSLFVTSITVQKGRDEVRKFPADSIPFPLQTSTFSNVNIKKKISILSWWTMTITDFHYPFRYLGWTLCRSLFLPSVSCRVV